MEELEKEFVPYDRSLRLKAIGFDEPCLGRYGEVDNLEFRFFKEPKSFDYGITSKTCLAPTFSQAFRWFRKKYGLSGVVNESFVGNQRYGVVFIKSEIGLSYIKSPQPTTVFDEYEKAELACLDKLIEIVEFKSTENNPNTRTMEKLIESNREFDEKNNGDVKYNPSDRNEDTPNITNFFI